MRICVVFICFLTGIRLFAQDSTQEKFNYFTAGLAFSSVPVIIGSGSDVNYENKLSISPVLTIRNRMGLGLSYSPKIVSATPGNGIYLNALTAGIEQYEKKTFDYSLSYSHYFMSSGSRVPYSPIKNDVSGSLTYKKLWPKIVLTAGYGFGNDTSGRKDKSVNDFGMSSGINHSFNWEIKELNFSVTPKVMVNAGTNQYFSFMNISKYISRSNNLKNTVKTLRGLTRQQIIAGIRKAVQPEEKFEVSNIEVGMECSVELRKLSLKPNLSFYLPAGSTAGSSVFASSEVSMEYHF